MEQMTHLDIKYSVYRGSTFGRFNLWKFNMWKFNIWRFNIWLQGTRTQISDAPVVAMLGACGDEGWKVPAKNFF